tara:strand:+ start:6047 stop:6553 length:507 start_codon:yes stop_codon:yes gene_type:complete
MIADNYEGVTRFQRFKYREDPWMTLMVRDGADVNGGDFGQFFRGHDQSSGFNKVVRAQENPSDSDQIHVCANANFGEVEEIDPRIGCSWTQFESLVCAETGSGRCKRYKSRVGGGVRMTTFTLGRKKPVDEIRSKRTTTTRFMIRHQMPCIGCPLGILHTVTDAPVVY